MRIPLVTHFVPTYGIGGVRTHLSLLERHDRHFRHVVIALFEEDMVKDISRKPFTCLPAAADLRNGIAAVARLLGELGTDIVHSHHTSVDLEAASAAAAAGIRGRVRTAHGISQNVYSLHGKRPASGDELDGAQMGRARALEAEFQTTICVSKELRMRLLSHGLQEDRLRVVPNAVPSAPERPHHPQLSCREALQIASDGYVVGFIGRLEAVKGVEHLAPTFALLREFEPVSYLLAMGEGRCRPNLLSSMRDKMLHHSFRLLPASPDTASFYSAIDVLFVPSESEGCPYVVLEAAARGVPVVAAAVGGIPEIVEDGVTGILFDRGDVQGAARALASVADRSVRQAFSTASRLKSRDGAAFQSYLSAMRDIYGAALLGTGRL